MDTPGLRESYYIHAFTWLSMRLLHLWLRYQSLSVLKFCSINLKRARILVNSHVLYDTVPGYIDVNKEEKLLAWENFLQPRITFGVPLKSMIPKDDFSHVVRAVLELYVQEKYVLFVNRHGSKVLNYYITYKVGATSLSVLKSLWQVYWLHNHHEKLDRDDILDWLKESLLKLEARFKFFLKQLEESGWQKDQISLKVPKHVLFEEADSIAEIFQ